MSHIFRSFLGALTEEWQEKAEVIESLEAQLKQHYAQAAEAWPTLSISEERFGAYLAATLLASPPSQGLASRLSRLHPADLYLACGCYDQDERALQLFEHTYIGLMRGAVRRYVSSRFTEDDLLQVLREKLFVGSETTAPKLLSYAGEGPLAGWLRITTLRIGLDKVRRGAQQKREYGDRDLALHNAPALNEDIELGFLKREYRSHFNEAFAQAFGVLESEQRNLLRQQLLFGLSIDQIGALYHIHRATAARRIAKARQQLLESTRSALIQKLKISEDEFESMMHLIQSNIDLSLQRLLKSQSTDK